MSNELQDDGRRSERLHAYHDGELSGLQRWLFERELRRSPALQAELESLSALGDLLRDHDAGGAEPDLWGAIALRLPAEDARRIEAAGEPPARWLPSWWIKPLGAVAATAVVAVVVSYSGYFTEAPRDGGSVVRWIDSGERSVMVLDDDPDTTIIWVLDSAAEGAWIGGVRDEV